MSLCLLSSTVVVVIVVQLPDLVTVGERAAIEKTNPSKKKTDLVKKKLGHSKPVEKIKAAYTSECLLRRLWVLQLLFDPVPLFLLGFSQ